MPRWIVCPYLAADVELTDERREHIRLNHPELGAPGADLIGDTLALPDTVRRDDRAPNTRLFTRWYDQVLGGKNLVVVVVTDEPGAQRHWVVTAYLTKVVRRGGIEWQRS